jgi:glycosyltransferase involved in cell wall biosynthesis
MVKASIIIATYNRPQLLPRAIKSARASGTQVEIVVVDDGSSAEIAKICQAVSGISYVRVERNQGVAGARNVGLVASHGEYLSFLDDDDLRLPDSLDKQIEILENNPQAGLIYGQAIPEDPSGARHHAFPADCPQGDILWELLIRNFIPCGSAVFRRACLSRVGMLDHRICGIDDWDLWVRIAELFPIIAIETPVMVWRQSTRTSGQGSSDTVDIIERGRRQFRQVWLRLPRVEQATQQKKRESWRKFSDNVSDHLVWEAFSALGEFRIQHAKKSALTALRLHPNALLSMLQRWTRISTLTTLLTAAFSPDDIAGAKTHFKRTRAFRS